MKDVNKCIVCPIKNCELRLTKESKFCEFYKENNNQESRGEQK